MRIILSLFAVFCALFADDVAQNGADSAKVAESKVAESTANTADSKLAESVAKIAGSAPIIIDPDVKLKDDIVGFERDKLLNVADIENPFVRIVRQAEGDAERQANKAKLEQALLSLKVKSIVSIPESADSANKRYTAQINNQWVKECRMVGKTNQCDEIAGWKVVSINDEEVTLRVDKYKDMDDRPLRVIEKKVALTIDNLDKDSMIK